MRELAFEKDRAHITLVSIGDGVINANAKGLVEYLNPVAEKMTGWSQESAEQKLIDDVFIVVNEKTGKTLANPMRKCLADKEIRRSA